MADLLDPNSPVMKEINDIDRGLEGMQGNMVLLAASIEKESNVWQAAVDKLKGDVYNDLKTSLYSGVVTELQSYRALSEQQMDEVTQGLQTQSTALLKQAVTDLEETHPSVRPMYQQNVRLLARLKKQLIDLRNNLVNEHALQDQFQNLPTDPEGQFESKEDPPCRTVQESCVKIAELCRSVDGNISAAKVCHQDKTKPLERSVNAAIIRLKATLKEEFSPPVPRVVTDQVKAILDADVQRFQQMGDQGAFVQPTVQIFHNELRKMHDKIEVARERL